MFFKNPAMKKLSPICLFTYARLDETKKTVQALQANYLAKQSDLFVFSDGPRNDSAKPKVEAVRDYLKTIKGFKTVSVLESSYNRGLADSIINGVSKIIEKYEKVIVVEDDLITSFNFLDFMNQALTFYEKNPKIFSISGYSFDLPSLKDFSKDFYLGYRASSWGWGTWRDQWKKVDWGVRDYSSFKWNPLQQVSFMRGGSDMPRMLKNQMRGKIDSWAIRWCYQQFKNEQFSIFPSRSKIQNIGFGADATHTFCNKRFLSTLDPGKKRDFIFDPTPKVDKRLASEFKSKFSIKNRLLDKCCQVLHIS